MVNENGNRMRSGAQTLLLLAVPSNVLILKALEHQSWRQADLRRKVGFPAQTTLRGQLKGLEKSGVVVKHPVNHFPRVLEYRLTSAGKDLLMVVGVLERWLSAAPEGALDLEGSGAKAAIKALADGWSTTMLRALAASPLSLTELDRVIAPLSYPSLERRLASMRLAGLVVARPGRSRGHGTPYGVTDWLKRGVAPLATAIRWERKHAPRVSTPLNHLEVETSFLLGLPLLKLPTDLNGCCRLAAELSSGPRRALSGTTVEVDRGSVVACTTELVGRPDAWALGSAGAWLDSMIDGEIIGLELGGDCRLARELVDRLHITLFRAPIRNSY
jgi:DNA-binding HxlR family transcriptional regulator